MVDRIEDPGRKELLKSAYRKIEDLRIRLAASEGRAAEPVAIIGMGCRFPGGVTDADSFWQLLSSGTDGVTEIPPDRWNVDEFYDPDPDAPGKMYVRRGGFIDNVRGFDPLFFRVSPQEASGMDAQQRVLLEVTWEALENAGQAPDKLSGAPTGVFMGLAGFDYSMMAVLGEGAATDSTHAATGGSHSIAAGRISYFLGLRGPCVAVDTACSSALTSIHLAMQSLRNGESRMALAGAINLVLWPDGNVIVCKARMLAPDGKCKTFDAAADGYARSEGCSVLVLKLLSQAEADGDRILAVIHGSACNQDGRTNGITAPNGNAQREVIQAALIASGLSAQDIDYVETHGTGTSLGDPIEVQALGEVFAATRPADRSLVLGAVKSNIGHLESAAGMAAIGKVILALQKEQIPANLHFHNPSPHIPWASLPFTIPTRLIPWPAWHDRRLAGVSAFGYSGTNVHMILGQAPRRAPVAIEQDRPCHLLTLSAQTPRALSELAERYVPFLNDNPAANLADVCFTANTGRAHLAHRMAVVVSTLNELKAQLQDFLEGTNGVHSAQSGVAPSQPAQVSLYVVADSVSEVHRQLYRQSPVFKAAIDTCNSAAIELFSASIPAALWEQSALPAVLPSPVNDVLAFALSYAMTAQWRDWGINPAAVSGSGVGGCVAAVFAGAISLHDGLRLAANPPAADRMSIDWSAPQASLLSPRTGLPVTPDSLTDPAERAATVEPLSDLAPLLRGFQQERTQIVLAIGALPEMGKSVRQLGSELQLICVTAANDSWSGLLNMLGGLYTAGVAIDWPRVESPWRRQRLALPTYPFQRQDCWLKVKPQRPRRQSSQNESHPLLGRRVYSSQFGDNIVFEVRFDTDRLPLLKDHRFFTTVVVPMTAMLEMGTSAGRIALKQSEIALDNFVIEQPLLLPDSETRLVQTVLTPEGADAYTFVILSAGVDKLDGAASWKRHCSGKLSAVPASVAPAAEPDILNHLKARHSESVDPQWFYSNVAESGVEYGPSFRLMRSIGRSAGGTMAHLQIPADIAHQSSEYGAHPGLLDAALQTMGIAYGYDREQSERKDVYMPVAVERYWLSTVGLTEMWCHTTIRSTAAHSKDTIIGDLQLYATSGQMIGEIRGLHFKQNVKKQFLQEMVERRLTSWLFEARWEPLPALPSAASIAGTWLVLADGNPVADEFASVVRRRRGRAIIARPGIACELQDSDNYTSRFDSPDDYDALLQAAIGAGEPLRGVVYFAASASAEGDAGLAVPRLAGSTTGQLLQLTQALARNGIGDVPVLALITQGFQTPNIGIRSSLVGGAAWGLGRVIAAELPDLHCKLVDIEQSLPASKAAEMLANELGSKSEENQVALGEGKRLALRLERADASIFSPENSLVADPGSAVEMEIGTRGDFRQLRFVPQQWQLPGPGQVQLRLLATALNFRDVLNALGMYPGNPGALGVECVGEIVAIGPDVSGWSVGEHVLAIPSRGYCTFANAPVNMIFRRPPNLSLPDAATLLVAYLTAAYSLCHLGKMKRGDRVLIHAAAGGVGLAAVQLAQQAGAEVFATAGSPAKREYLRQLGVPHVMDSRSLEFASQIRELTADRGVDLILNSLTGPAIVQGLSLLRSGGCFLEIGKNELLSAEQVACANPHARYHVIDLLGPFGETPHVMRQLFTQISDSLAKGELRPLPHRTFSLSEAPQAFRYMAAAKHIGKVIVVHRPAAVGASLEPSGTYLITGGLGGLGLAVARWMVAEGARRIVLVGRSAPDPTAQKAILDLKALGAEITVVQADVGDRQQVADLLARHTSPSAPLRGVIHAAGVIDDGALLSQDSSRLARVLRPKIDGAWNLHESTLHLPLDFFVMFSSGAGLFGNAGQSSYAAANVFLDQLALARQAAGLPALSINWGPWAKVGMAAAMDERHATGWDSRGLSTIEPAQGTTILQMLIGKSQIAQMAVLPVEESAWRQAAGEPTRPLIKNLVACVVAEPAATASSHSQAAERLRQAEPGGKRDVLIELVSEIVLEIFGLERRSLPPDQNLTMLGMDSLLAIQLSNRLKTSFSAAVPPTLTFQYPTIEAIADYLANTLWRTNEAPQSSDTKFLVVPFRAEGNRRPLFCISGAGGHPFIFKSLLPLLDPEQPLYGLQYHGLEKQAETFSSVEAIAALFVSRIREVQPSGPYRLAGYSLGSILAFEMAQQLIAQQQKVELLVLFDGVPPLQPRPQWQKLWVHAGHILRRRPREAVGYAINRVRNRTRPGTNVLFNDGDQAPMTEFQVAETIEGVQVAVAAALRYRPRHYAGTVSLLRAREREPFSFMIDEPDNGWTSVADRVEIRPVPGTHWSLFDKENRPELASGLNLFLAALPD